MLHPRRPLAAALAASLLGLAPAAEAQPASGRLVLYTSQLDADAQATVDAFKLRHPGIEVEWVRGGTNTLIPRLRAEFAAGAPRADLLLIADSLTMETMKAEGRLLRWPEAPRGGVPAAHVDPEGHYWGTKLITTGIVRNRRAPMPITSWNDLADARARNLSTMPSPAVSGAALVHLYAIVQNPALGWPYLERLARNGLSVRGGNGQVMQAVAGGERAFGMIIDYLPIREAAKGAPVEFVFPTEGVSAITEPVAILAGSQRPGAAGGLAISRHCHLHQIAGSEGLRAGQSLLSTGALQLPVAIQLEHSSRDVRDAGRIDVERRVATHLG